MSLQTEYVAAESLIGELRQHSIVIPPEIDRALALYGAAADSRSINPEGALRAAFMRGELTVENLNERLLDAAIGTLATSPTTQGQPLARVVNAVQELAAIAVTGWLEDSVEEHVEALSAEFNEYADVINRLAPTALTGGESVEQILAMGNTKAKAALADREKINTAVGQLSGIHYLINRVLTNAGQPQLTPSRLVDPDTVKLDNLEELHGLVNAGSWITLARAGYKIRAVSAAEAAEVDAQIAAQARQAEIDEWRPKIEAEARRLVGIAERGLHPAWVLSVPEHLHWIIDETAESMDLSPRSRPRPVIVGY
jgi:hypothetical protein